MERNKCLKSKLKVIKNQIENEFKREKRSKIDNQKENINWKKNIQFNILFDKFKNKIEKLNSNLVNSNLLLNSKKNEDKLYCLKEELKALKKENETLNKYNQNQELILKENNEKINYSNDKLRIEKCNHLKEEIKILKDYNIKIQNQLKKQDNQIIKIENHCKLINENIENKKNSKNEDLSNIDNEINSLSEQINQNTLLLKNQENTYKKTIKNQMSKIEQLSEDIKILKIQIDNIKKEETINLLKYKEIEKFKNNVNKKLVKSQSNKSMNFNNYRMINRKNIPFEIGKFRNNSQDNIYNKKYNSFHSTLKKFDKKNTRYLILNKEYTETNNISSLKPFS